MKILKILIRETIGCLDDISPEDMEDDVFDLKKDIENIDRKKKLE